jgi:hypothetical protein
VHQVGTRGRGGKLGLAGFSRRGFRALDREAGIGDHGQVGRARLALARQVVAEEDRVHDVQRQRL